MGKGYQRVVKVFAALYSSAEVPVPCSEAPNIGAICTLRRALLSAAILNLSCCQPVLNIL